APIEPRRARARRVHSLVSERTLSVLDGSTFVLVTALLGLLPGDTDVEADLPDTIGHAAIRRQPDNSLLRPATTTV
ncbi:MAG: hypothetical protein ACLP0L_04750, partial [Solirubrobacteraceae bacterium]